MIALYYYPSYISLAPHIVLEELGVPYQLNFVDRYANAHKRDAYLKLNPNGLLPVLVDGDLVLYEASAVCLHLADTHAEAGLAPAVGSAERAHLYKWLAWLSTGLQPALSMYLHPGNWTPDPAAQAALSAGAEARVAALFDIVDAELQHHGGPWLLGADYSVADPYALVLCRWSRGMARPGAGWPHFGPYAERVLARPAVQRALKGEHLSAPWI